MTPVVCLSPSTTTQYNGRKSNHKVILYNNIFESYHQSPGVDRRGSSSLGRDFFITISVIFETLWTLINCVQEGLESAGNPTQGKEREQKRKWRKGEQKERTRVGSRKQIICSNSRSNNFITNNFSWNKLPQVYLLLTSSFWTWLSTILLIQFNTMFLCCKHKW